MHPLAAIVGRIGPLLLHGLLVVAPLLPGQLAAQEGGLGAEARALLAVENGVRLNERYFQVINAAVSNYGTDEEKLAFRRSIHRHVQAEIYYRALHYNRALRELQKSQLLLIQLYERLIDRAIAENRAYLGRFAPRVLNEPGPIRRKKYLQLGLRDLGAAARYRMVQANRNPLLIQVRLTDLEESFKLTRQARRFYVLLSLEFESVAKPNDPEGLDYAEIRRLIISGYPERRGEMLLVHDDNHFRVGTESRDLFELYWGDPDFSGLESSLAGWPERPEEFMRHLPALGEPGHLSPRRIIED